MGKMHGITRFLGLIICLLFSTIKDYQHLLYCRWPVLYRNSLYCIVVNFLMEHLLMAVHYGKVPDYKWMCIEVLLIRHTFIEVS